MAGEGYPLLRAIYPYLLSTYNVGPATTLVPHSLNPRIKFPHHDKVLPR